MDLTHRLSIEPRPTKLLCRLRLCFASKKLYHGEAIFENDKKKNHDLEHVWGIYRFNECPDCGRVTVATLTWQVLNDQRFLDATQSVSTSSLSTPSG